MTAEDCPVSWTGITETVTTTEQANDQWNVAALGVNAGDGQWTARTWGPTRTKRNLTRTGRAYVQFVSDPLVFSRAALDRWTRDEPILSAASAWVDADVRRIGSGRENGTAWVDWMLEPRSWEIRRRTVPTPGRGFGAVIEMTVAASRLGVDGYDDERLRERLSYFASVAHRCGGTAEREAADWIESRIATASQSTTHEVEHR